MDLAYAVSLAVIADLKGLRQVSARLFLRIHLAVLRAACIRKDGHLQREGIGLHGKGGGCRSAAAHRNEPEAVVKPYALHADLHAAAEAAGKLHLCAAAAG